MKNIKIRRFKRIRKSRKIKKFRMINIQPLCGEYLSWVHYLFFKEEDCGSFICMILNWMWVREFFLGRSVYVTLKIEVENMKVFCTLIFTMENG